MSIEPPARRRTSVVISAFSDERFRDLKVAVESLQAQTTPVDEIVVSVDRNRSLLERVQRDLPQVIAVPNVHHDGAGGARNSGVSASTGEIVAFIDDDVRVAPDWLETLLPAFDDPRVLGIGGRIDPLWATERPSWFPEEFDWVIGCSYRGLPNVISPVRNVISANMAVRRSVFDQLGGFLADFGKQGALSEPEETEFCIRAGTTWPDHHWLYLPAARVDHRVTPERETWDYFLTRCLNEGRGKAHMRARSKMIARLTSERLYVTSTLPAGVIGGFLDGVRGDASGLRRAGAIVVGLSVTATAYARESRRMRRDARSLA